MLHSNLLGVQFADYQLTEIIPCRLHSDLLGMFSLRPISWQKQHPCLLYSNLFLGVQFTDYPMAEITPVYAP